MSAQINPSPTPDPIPDPEARGKLLPGVAAIILLLLLLTLANVYGALVGAFGSGRGKYGVLALCTMLVAGLLGLLRMRRWGWSLVLAGCLLLSGGYFYVFTLTHSPFLALQGFFMLLFFLYLVRPEVRDRML